MSKIAIIGAGIAGLNLANLLKEVAEVVVFEKSSKLGGRMATHRDETFSFDHGAQFFTVKTPEFQHFVNGLVDVGVVARWDARFVALEYGQTQSQRVWDDEFPHYVGTPSMNAIGQYLANNIDIRFNQLITGIKRDQSHWLIETSEAEHGPFDWVVVTTPAEQASQILPESLYLKWHLSDVAMQPCFTLMLGYASPRLFAWDAAFISKSILSWVSVNSSKPDRNNHFALVAMSRNDWAHAHFEMSEPMIIAEMMTALKEIGIDNLEHAAYIKLKRWKYANASRQHEPLELIDDSLQLACCGDWCISGRVESAFTSSLQLANQLKQVLA